MIKTRTVRLAFKGDDTIKEYYDIINSDIKQHFASIGAAAPARLEELRCDALELLAIIENVQYSQKKSLTSYR